LLSLNIFGFFFQLASFTQHIYLLWAVEHISCLLGYVRLCYRNLQANLW
jgi:hypothetical protein